MVSHSPEVDLSHFLNFPGRRMRRNDMEMLGGNYGNASELMKNNRAELIIYEQEFDIC